MKQEIKFSVLFLFVFFITTFSACSNSDNGNLYDTDNVFDTSIDGTDSNQSNDSDTNYDISTDNNPSPVEMIDIAPDDESIMYEGRVDLSSEGKAVFAYPGISIKLNFTGQDISAKFTDNGSTQYPNYLYVIIDGGTPEKIQLSPAQEDYSLATGLDDTTHTIEIAKLGESSSGRGKIEFLGFHIEGYASKLAPAPLTKTIEFAGDSITCGYGNEESISYADISAPGASYPYTTEYSNAYLAYGAVTARALNANYRAVAYSGKGITRNSGGSAGATIPELYLRTFPDEADSILYDVESNKPDVLVINLGTNDFSAGLDATPGGTYDQMREDYRNDYVTFLETLRGYYPDTPFILAIGPMISDYYPAGWNAWTSIQADIAAVISTVSEGGDSNVYSVIFDPQTEPYGSDWHPTAATHKTMSDKIVKFINDNNLLQ
ncbi:MAG: hypothetical protein JXR91_08955 [Deltaproteobacteria bacterium]|nr:hypothetical protein [Deltaproteobacteria bacterium]